MSKKADIGRAIEFMARGELRCPPQHKYLQGLCMSWANQYPIIRADEVGDLYYGLLTSESDYTYWDIRKEGLFVNAAPPYSRFIVDCQTYVPMVDKEFGKQVIPFPYGMVTFVEFIEVDPAQRIEKDKDSIVFGGPDYFAPVANLILYLGERPEWTPKWIATFTSFVGTSSAFFKENLTPPRGPHAISVAAIMEDGSLLVDEEDGTPVVDICRYEDGVVVPSEVDEELMGTDNQDIDITNGWQQMSISLLTMTFMNCKNVEVKPWERKANHKRRLRRSGVTLREHVLDITPMNPKVIRKYNTPAEPTGSKQAMHMCRGHFKDFRQGKGLFGRYKSVYWWGSQLRGSLDVGLISKSYNVKVKEDV